MLFQGSQSAAEMGLSGSPVALIVPLFKGAKTVGLCCHNVSISHAKVHVVVSGLMSPV